MKHIKVAAFPFFAAALLSVSQAKATLFNYESMNVEGAVSGTVQGGITLPDGDGIFAASLVTIDSYPASLGLDPTPISIVTGDAPSNSLTVGGGQILSSDFLGLVNGGTALALNSGPFCNVDSSFLDALDAIDCGDTGVQDLGSSTLSLSPAAASVPGPLPLLGAAAAFAHSRRLRGRLRDGSRPQA